MIRYPESVIRNARHLIELGEAVLAGKPIERCVLRNSSRRWYQIDTDMALFSKTCSTYRVSRNQQLELPKGTRPMTPQRAKELAPVIAAYGEGKTIQYRSDSRFRWDDYPNNNPHSNPTFTASGEYRIKPEPTWRMWKPEEVPVGGIIVGLHNEYTAVGAVHAIATITTDAVTVVLKTKNGEVPTRTDTLRVIPGVTEWYWGCNPNQRFKVGVLEEPK